MPNKIIEEIIDKLRCLNKEWFYSFFAMLENAQVSQDTICKALALVAYEKNVYAGINYQDDCLFRTGAKAKKCIDNFFAYCLKLKQEKGDDWFKGFLTRAIDNIEKNFQMRATEPNSTKTNVFNLFMRELVIENPNEVKIKNVDSGDETRMDLDFAGISIGHLIYNEISANVRAAEITDFRTIPGLERMGLGKYIFCEFCRDVLAKGSDYSAMAWCVMKGLDGEKAYSSWGGYPIFPVVGEDGNLIIDKRLTDEEYAAIDCTLNYYFSNDIVLKNSQKYSKIYGTRKIDEIVV